MLWRFRTWCKGQPKAVAKFLLSVPWGDPLVSVEVYSLLQQWVDIEPIDALELLNHNFTDKFVREFAVYYLQRLSDDELQQVLLQLVQALKHEYNHDSMLARFLIIKAVFNQTQLGHYFFWLMKACLSKVSPYRERYAVVLEIYLRFCGRFRQDLKCQCFLYDKLTDVSFPHIYTMHFSAAANFRQFCTSRGSSLAGALFIAYTGCCMRYVWIDSSVLFRTLRNSFLF
jgi:hypothetical protein